MWISLSRQQSRRGSPMPSSSSRSSIPPPGPPSRPERRKSSGKKGGEEKQTDPPATKEKETSKTYPTAPPLPEDTNENFRPTSLPVMNAWGSPSHEHPSKVPNENERDPWNRNDRGRKSFRLSGHIRDISTERNVLPLWLEEDTQRGRESERNIPSIRTEDADVSDVSFDSRWDSLNDRCVKKTSAPTVRPPGWEDVRQQEKQRKNRTKKTKANFCPSFTIKDLPNDNTQQEISNIKPLSPPITINIEPPSSGDAEPSVNHKGDAFNMTDLSSDVNLIPHSIPVREHTQSTSNIAPRSASNSPSHITSRSSPSAIEDKHLWASSDSFICEDFSFVCGKPVEKEQNCATSESPPRSYSQVLLQHSGNYEEEITDYDGIYTDIDQHEDLTPDQNFGLDSDSFDSFYQHCSHGNDTDVSDPSCQNIDNMTDGNFGFPDMDEMGPQGVVYLESYSPSDRQTNTPLRENWIRFDSGTLDHLDRISNDVSSRSLSSSLPPDNESFEFVHQSNFNSYRRKSLESVTSPTSPTSPVLPRNCSGSTLNLVEPRLQQTPETYTGQFVRTCSIRGCRAGKRVTRSVSQKMKSKEYGKLSEPVAPMLSKAALTMNSGPGLFEMEPHQTGEDIPQEVNVQLDEIKNEELPQSSDLDPKNLTHSAGLPGRSGSLRVPRLPTIFVRRSVSLNAHKGCKSEVPFQRLPESRGSFRKALSGISAMARNIRRRSGSSLQTSESASSHMAEKVLPNSKPIPQLQRSGSICSFTKQIPKAPRLPRRAISHKQNNSHES